MNVVFIMADQQRADSFGPGRHPCADFPNMERLSRESVTFPRFYTAAMACVPSRYSFLTGRHPWAESMGNGRFFTGEETTWMSVLRDRGYRCVSVGKTHMVHAGSYHIPVPLGASFGQQGGWDHFHPAPSPEPEETYFDVHAATRAADALRSLGTSRPFALFLGFHAPHEPYVMPQRYLDFCRPENVPLPEARCEGEYRSKSEGYRDRVELFRRKFGEEVVPDGSETIRDEAIRAGIAGHHCLLKMVDDCLGRVLEELDTLGLRDNTLVVYTADHGDVLGEHGLFNKAATFYEGEVHIPMTIRFPDGAHAGTRVEHLASSIDWVPTLFDVLGIDGDMALPGLSLVPAIQRDEPVREWVSSATPNGMMLRTDTHKFWYDAACDDGELYDLAADPMELSNLYSDPESRGLRTGFFEQMLRIRMREDRKQVALTEREQRLHQEIRASYEPEIGPRRPVR